MPRLESFVCHNSVKTAIVILSAKITMILKKKKEKLNVPDLM